MPDYLCCKITLDIFRDPVITPSGVTYERAVILDHLKKVYTLHLSLEKSIICFSVLIFDWSSTWFYQVGKFDPITREPLDPSQLIPNLAIKEAVQAYLRKHGWAYKMDWIWLFGDLLEREVDIWASTSRGTNNSRAELILSNVWYCLSSASSIRVWYALFGLCFKAWNVMPCELCYEKSSSFELYSFYCHIFMLLQLLHVHKMY